MSDHNSSNVNHISQESRVCSYGGASFSVDEFRRFCELKEPADTKGLSSSHISPSGLRMRPTLDSVIENVGGNRPVRIWESEPQQAQLHTFSEAYAEVVAEGALVSVKRARYNKVVDPSGDEKVFRKRLPESNRPEFASSYDEPASDYEVMASEVVDYSDVVELVRNDDGYTCSIVIHSDREPETRIVEREVRWVRRGKAQFSADSRRRLMRKIASVNREYRPLFVTLTYPDHFRNDPVCWKRDIDAFGKRFRRKFGSGGAIWRMEMKERLSGENAGFIAPHFHLLVWGCDYATLKNWISKAWYEVVDSGDERHLRAGTSVEIMRSWSGVNYYVSKYMAKIVAESAGDVGRWWGVIGKECIPWGTVIKIWLTNDRANKAIRLGRKMIGLNGISLSYGLTWLINGERFLDYLEFLEAD